MIWGGLFLLIAAFPWQLRVPSELSILAHERQIVRAPSDGRIERIHIREGERVERGDLLLEYDSKELLLERRTKQAELTQAREELRLLDKQNPTFREEIRVSERALETARAHEQAALQDFDRAQQLWTAGLISQDAFDSAGNVREEAEARRREAEARIALVRKQSPGSRNEQMEAIPTVDVSTRCAGSRSLMKTVCGGFGPSGFQLVGRSLPQPRGWWTPPRLATRWRSLMPL